MLEFDVSPDSQFLILKSYTEEVEKKQLELSLTKKIHNHFFHPLVKKKKIWDGSICFIDKKGHYWRVPIGLWREVLQIGEDYSIKIEINGLDKIVNDDLTLEEYTEWVNEFFAGGIGGDPEKMPRDYQIETAWKLIKYRYSISEVATSSGKTLISFMIFAYLKQKGLIRKFLMIVPSTNLVFQGSEDFEDYGLHKLGSKIQQIGGGSKLREGCDVIIGTFQSLVKQDQEFFEEADLVFVDEAHHTNSMSIKKIVAHCMHSTWRFGLTGTLTKRGTADYLTIQQFLGPLIVEISPSFLFDNNYATPVSIKIVVMDWLEKEYKDKLADLKLNNNNLEGNEVYNLERKLVIESKKRLNYVVDFIGKTSKNSLVLFQSVKDEYGKQIWNLLREKNSDKEVFYVDGDTNEGLREEYKTRMASGANKILIATYGTFSTGISINNLHNIFLVESYKSEVLIKQSLGRGMRKMEGKDKVNIIDFVDDFSSPKYQNYLMKHSEARIQIYKNESFEYKIYKIKL
ncbi:MAG: DEAD/DEAH box helicase [Chitinophagia bacterium]|nr:DEAD/DEAH box helicase [Chitinophagia bacterium]